MLTVTAAQFRIVSSTALLALYLMWVPPLLDFVPFTDDVDTARHWYTHGSILPTKAIAVWAALWMIFYTVGLTGMLFLWRDARWLLCVALISNIAIQPFTGLVVFSAYEASCAGVLGAASMWLIVIAFWSPFADQLRPIRQPSAT